MSSRALRRLQREQEQERQLALLRATEPDGTDPDGQEDVVSPSTKSSQTKTNAFDMLDAADDGDDSELEPDVNEEGEDIETPSTPLESSILSNPAQKKRKKKKQKKKAKQKSDASGPAKAAGTDSVHEPEMDEIDRALEALSTRRGRVPAESEASNTPDPAEAESAWETNATKLLGIDSKSLNPVNEMKTLFGNIVLEASESWTSPRNPRRREQNQQGGVDLATALTGRYSPASRGKDLGALATRRNVFVQGREEWPLATSGGLSMEYEGKMQNFEKLYSIAHNNSYTDVQRQFRLCVESMQPENMIHLLTFNPYHIATLLQVSEIAKHQGDHSVSGDLLERALFSFGRSVHSTFPAALRDGTARISFDNGANRELYLAIWRYVQNLGMRGTWRTAYEWAKMLLQFNTTSDPYGMTLMIDQLALRGRQHVSLIELCSEEAYGPSWHHLPNIQISLSLAYLRSSQPKLARQSLAVAMHKYPYILSALGSALEISPLPRYLWGKLPSSDAEKLYSELYVTRTIDLWNTPETTSLIAEVAETMSHYQEIIASSQLAPKLEISLEEARHIMLLEIPALIALLPRRFTTLPTSSSDVLPPPDSLSNFTARAPSTGTFDTSATGAMQALLNAATMGVGAPVAGASGLLTRVLNWFHAPAGLDEPQNAAGESEGQAAFRELGEQLGNAPPGMVEEMLRMHMLEGGGGWDEDMGSQDESFRRALGSDGDVEDTDESLPELDEVRTVEDGDHNQAPPVFQGPVQRALAATVEDEDERNYPGEYETHIPTADMQPPPFPREGPSGVLERLPQPQPPRPRWGPTPSTTEDHEHVPSIAASDSSDPQRIQRWLLSTGLQSLQKDSSNSSALAEYVSKLRGLRQRDREWTLNIVKQRAGAELADKIKHELER